MRSYEEPSSATIRHTRWTSNPAEAWPAALLRGGQEGDGQALVSVPMPPGGAPCWDGVEPWLPDAVLRALSSPVTLVNNFVLLSSPLHCRTESPKPPFMNTS